MLWGVAGSTTLHPPLRLYRSPVLPHALYMNSTIHGSHARAARAPLSRKLGRASKRPQWHPWPGEDFASRGHAHLWRRRRPHLRLAWLAGLLLGGRPGLQEASPALAACSHEPAMLGAAGAGDEAALLTSLNKLLVACRSPSLSPRRALCGTRASGRLDAHTGSCRTGRCRTCR